VTETFTPVALDRRLTEGHTLTAMPDGGVLVAGGWGGPAKSHPFDADRGFAPTRRLNVPRSEPEVVALPDGRVLLVGGGFDGEDKRPIEAFDPATETYAKVGRTKEELEARPIEALRWQLVARGRAHGYEAHPAAVDRLHDDPVLMLTGTAGAEAAGLGLVGSDRLVEAYVDAAQLDHVVKRYHLRPSLEPNVVLRPIPDFGWPPPRPAMAPTVAIALDLLENREPRARQLGRQLLDRTER